MVKFPHCWYGLLPTFPGGVGDPKDDRIFCNFKQDHPNLSMTTQKDIIYLQRAIELAKKGIDGGMGGPFGCVIVKDGAVVGEGCNRVTSTNDPTAHAASA